MSTPNRCRQTLVSLILLGQQTIWAHSKLIGLGEGYVGEILTDDPELSPILGSVRVARGRFVGPIFDVPSGGWVGDPTTRLIKKKFSKRYDAPYPRELLAYIDLNPTFPAGVWRARLLDFLEAESKPLPFQRIWVFDCRKNEVTFEYAAL